MPVGRNLDLTLVLEYIDQDLSTYLAKVPACGLSRDSIKVWTRRPTDRSTLLFCSLL